MVLKRGGMRLAVALSLSAWIAVQIPAPGNGVGLAADCYGCGSGGSGGGRTILQSVGALLVGYGIYSAAKSAPPPTPPTSPLPSPESALPPPAETKPIYDVARENEDLTGAAVLAEAAGMKDPLRNDGPFTAFLPTNMALSQLDSVKRADLMQPENRATLETLVRSLIVKGSYTIEQLKAEAARAGTEGFLLETLSGEKLRVTQNAKEGLRLNGIPLVETDIVCSNGLIHPLTALPLPETDRPGVERR